MTFSPARSGKPKVVINALHAKSGGGVTYLRSILRYFGEDPDLEFHLFLHEEQYDLFAPIPEGVHLHLLDFRSSFITLLAWEQFAMPFLTRLMSADVTFSPANYGPLFAPNTVILLRNALSVVGGERRLRKRLYWAGVAAMTWLSLVMSKRAIAVSRYAGRHLTFGTNRLFGRHTEIVYHGVDARFRPSRRPDRENPFLLVVSDIYVQKNLHNLIAALPTVLEHHPDIRLKIAGRPNDEDYYNDLRETTRLLKVDHRIDFLGHCDTERLIELYDTCLLLVFPSTVETFGNPLVEAMACAVPIASSNSAAMPEIAGNAAVFFDPLDSDEIAERLIELVGDTALAKRLSRAGAERAGRFSWKITAERTCRVLKASAR